MKKHEEITSADDPRATAWALGEKSELSEAECAEIEALLERDTEFAQAVEEISGLERVLADELGREAPVELTPTQRMAIEGAAGPSRAARVWKGTRVAVGVAIAASFLVLVGSLLFPVLETGDVDSTRPYSYSIFGNDDLASATPSAETTVSPDASVDSIDSLRAYSRKTPETTTSTLSVELRSELQSLGYASADPAASPPASRYYEYEPLPESLLVHRDRVELERAPRPEDARDDERLVRLEDGYHRAISGDRGGNTEAYDLIVENEFKSTRVDSLSTFSIDVDTASYSNMRRFLTNGQLPPKDSVRIEELVNYFSYTYPQPIDAHPFSVNTEVAACPWSPKHRLVQVGLKGREFSAGADRGRNFVFLLDVSGSMQSENKLPLVKDSMRMLLSHFGKRDRVAICVYAGASGLVLPSTSAVDSAAIFGALERLKAGGSTNGGAGIQLAYDVAQRNFIDGGINRVILATDGDFNVGVTDRGSLVRLIEEKAKSGVFLTVLGYGMGNLKDASMEQLADKGNGNYAYIDTLNEAKKVLVHEASATLETIAKDVKIQIEFNPAKVAAHRLVGYENRVLAHTDFNDDTKDAGEIGAGHTVTAIYEIVPVGVEESLADVDPLKYQKPPVRLSSEAASGELMNVKLRYKEPEGQTSKLIEHPVHDSDNSWAQSSADFRFAAAVASFGMLLRDSRFKGSTTLDSVIELATEGAEVDPFGYRLEFLELARKARSLVEARER